MTASSTHLPSLETKPPSAPLLADRPTMQRQSVIGGSSTSGLNDFSTSKRRWNGLRLTSAFAPSTSTFNGNSQRVLGGASSSLKVSPGLSTLLSISPLALSHTSAMPSSLGARSIFTSVMQRAASPAGPTTAGPSLPRPSFRSNPFRYALTFVVVHPALTWACVGPMYLLCHYTNAAAYLLTGPSGIMVLNTRIPSLLPERSLYGLRETREVYAQHHKKDKRGEPTIEDWMEVAIKKAAGATWKTAKGASGMIGKAKHFAGDLAPDPEHPEQSKWGRWSKALARSADDLNKDGAEALAAGQGVEKEPGMLSKYVRNQAQEIRVRNVFDGVTAWLLVKALLPIRLPLSLWLTPRIASRFV